MRFERRAGGAEPFAFYDKVPTKFAGLSDDQLAPESGSSRPLVARQPKNVVMMPSFVNTIENATEGTMVDTWATVGSCAQIGKCASVRRCGRGGVLRAAAGQSIIEDNCFIGARSEWSSVIVELCAGHGRVHRPEHEDRPRDRRSDHGRVPTDRSSSPFPRAEADATSTVRSS